MVERTFECNKCHERYRIETVDPQRKYRCRHCHGRLKPVPDTGQEGDDLDDSQVEMVTVEDPLIGHKLGPYRILSRQGEGAMGTVYRAKHMGLQRVSALKILPPGLIKRSPEAVKRFMREARASAALEHPNIVTTYNVGKVDEWHFIDMQFVDGQSVGERLTGRKQLGVEEATHIVMETAKALAEAHDHGIVHRDIKPGNILLDTEGHVKVADFGVAKIAEHDPLDKGPVGTAAFMSPELWDGAEVDGRSDIYALGCTYFYLLTGTHPFRGKSWQAVMQKHRKKPAPDPAEHVPGLPDRVRRIIAKAMAKKPEDRYQTCEEIVQELLALETEIAVADEPTEPSSSGEPADEATGLTESRLPDWPQSPPAPHGPGCQKAIDAIKALGIKLGILVVTIVALIVIGSLSKRGTSSGTVEPDVRRQNAAEARRRAAEKEEQFARCRRVALAHELKHEWAEAVERYEQALKIKQDETVRASHQTALHHRGRAEAQALAEEHDYAAAEARLIEAIQIKDVPETRRYLETIQSRKEQADEYRAVVAKAKALEQKVECADDWNGVIAVYRTAKPLPEDVAEHEGFIDAAEKSKHRAKYEAVVKQAEKLAAATKTADEWAKVIAVYQQAVPPPEDRRGHEDRIAHAKKKQKDVHDAAVKAEAERRKQAYDRLLSQAQSLLAPHQPNRYGLFIGVAPGARRRARQLAEEALTWIPDGKAAPTIRDALPEARPVKFGVTAGRLQVQALGAGQLHEVNRRTFQGRLSPGEWVAVSFVPLVLKRDFALEWDGAPQCFVGAEDRYSLWQSDSEDGPRRRVGLDARREEGLAKLEGAADSREKMLTSIILSDLKHEIARAAVKHLPIAAVKVEQAQGLEILNTLPNLRHLDLSGTNIADLSSLRGLVRLTSLNLHACHALGDVSALKGLTSLTTVDLGECPKLRDIRAIEALVEVTTLRLRDCDRLTDLTPLSSLRNLTLLDLRDCERVSDLTPLGNLPHLVRLDVSACPRLPKSEIEEIKGKLSNCTIRE